MANLLVMMEFYRGTILSVSLEALGQARRLGTALGMTVYALVPLPSGPARGDGDITAACGLHGADKVVFLTGEALGTEGEMRFQSFSPVLMQACTQLVPRLFLFGDTPAARDVAPRLAVRLGAAYLARGAVLERDGQLLLCDTEGRHVRLITGDENSGDDFGENESVPPAPPPVVMTVPPGRFELAEGIQDADMLLVSAHERDMGSDVTPVTGSGFIEETLDAQPLDARLGGAGLVQLAAVQASSWDSPVPSPTQAGGAATPLLWAIETDGEPVVGAMYRIAIGPDASRAASDYSLEVPEGVTVTTCQALRAQLLLPVSRQTLARRGRSVLRAPENTSADGWAALENTETGEPDATSPDLSASVPPEVREGGGKAAAPRTPTPVASTWDGFSEPGEGVPEFELENADTAPVSIQAVSNQAALDGGAARSADRLPSSPPRGRKPVPGGGKETP